MEDEILGYCKECGQAINSSDEIPEYPGIFECPNCDYPNSTLDLWNELPDYLIRKDENE